jgi:hypothetical protein
MTEKSAYAASHASRKPSRTRKHKTGGIQPLNEGSVRVVKIERRKRPETLVARVDVSVAAATLHRYGYTLADSSTLRENEPCGGNTPPHVIRSFRVQRANFAFVAHGRAWLSYHPIPRERLQITKYARRRKECLWYRKVFDLKRAECEKLAPMRTLGSASHGYRSYGCAFVASRYEPDADLPLRVHADGYICRNLGSPYLESSRPKASQFVHNHAVVAHPVGKAHRNSFRDSGGLCLSTFCETSSRSWVSVIRSRAINANLKPSEIAAVFTRHLIFAGDFKPYTALKFIELTLQLVREPLEISHDAFHRRAGWRSVEAVRDASTHGWTLNEMVQIAQSHSIHLERRPPNAKRHLFSEHVHCGRVTQHVALLKRAEPDVAGLAQMHGFAHHATCGQDEQHKRRYVDVLTERSA